MIWLFPLYLLGAGAIIAPILMHLRRKPPQNRVEFSSLMFLEAQTPVPVSKRRLEHWLLLLLRCLVLLLLALMFARPLWRNAQDQAGTQHEATAILLDRSASMRRGELWKLAVAQATEVIQSARPEDRFALATFDGEVQSLWTFDEDNREATTRSLTLKQRLAEIQPGWGRTDLGSALTTAASWFSSASAMTGLRKHIVVISDLQEGARLEALRSMVWPENITVSVRRLEVPNGDNFSLALAAAAGEEPTAPETGLQSPAVRVRLANMRDSKLTDFKLAWETAGGDEVAGYLPPGSSRVLTAPPINPGASGQVLRITGDAWDFDNRIYTAPLQPKTAKVVYLGDEKTRNEAASPLYYLSRALQTTAAIAAELLVIPTSAPALPPESHIIFATEAAAPGSQTQRLRTFIEQGGMCVQVVDSPAAQASLRQLTGAGDISIREGVGTKDGYLMLGDVNAAHPLLRPFADARLRDFTKLRFWKHRGIALGPQASKQMEVLATFDNGEPALVACAIGKGTLILLASGWHPADSQLALSTKFVPLLYGWLAAAGFQNDQSTSLLVGDPLPAEPGSVIVAPDKKSVTVTAGEPVTTTMPGFYSVKEPSAAKALIYAVNLTPEESRVTPMEPDQLRELGPRLEAKGHAGQGAHNPIERERLAASDEETRQRAWLWILAGLLCVLGGETWLAGRIKTPGEVLTSGT